MCLNNITPNPVVLWIFEQVIFKSGDDLRQDQLIMQMISLMDSLLKRVNLDLRLVVRDGDAGGAIHTVSTVTPSRLSATMRRPTGAV